ncbi:MAG: pitrilysin family protein [Candidatus Pacebacteria bacterium]|nr:pitrilysin family protein [Candidatus Paceibacterota bacterium]
MNSTAARITEKNLFENGRIFIAPTNARDVVTVAGSVFGGPNMLPRLLTGVPLLAGGLFDAGTKAHTKDVLREALASRGATLSFSSGGGSDRTSFSGSCLPEDLTFLLKTIVECLHEASFPQKEILLERAQILGRIQESATETRTQATNELWRILYDERHVNYVEKDADVKRYVSNVTRKQLIDFRSMLGKGGLVLAIAGDTDSSIALKAVERSFAILNRGTLTASVKTANGKKGVGQERKVAIANKANIDVFLGASVPLTRDDDLFLPFVVLSDMLGGGFAGHLMQTVRERDGLTYGISTAPSGFAKDVTGAFRIWSTFSPDLFEKGLEAIQKEVRTFFSKGLTEDALRSKKEEILGSYVIGLSTTHGLANALHSIGVEEKPLSRIDEYPNLIRAVTVGELQRVADLIPYTQLSIAAAGTFAK